MNYRQWKKNYKKIHGYNPPLAEDKRKQAKVMKKALKQIPLLVDTEKMTNTVINGLANAFKVIGEAFINVGNSLGGKIA